MRGEFGNSRKLESIKSIFESDQLFEQIKYCSQFIATVKIMSSCNIFTFLLFCSFIGCSRKTISIISKDDETRIIILTSSSTENSYILSCTTTIDFYILSVHTICRRIFLHKFCKRYTNEILGLMGLLYRREKVLL